MKFLVLLGLFLVSIPVRGQTGGPRPEEFYFETNPEKFTPVQSGNRFTRYLASHKELLIADTLVTLAWSADAASSVHCQHVSNGCIEQNFILGKHPSNLTTYLYAEGAAAVMVTFNHLLWHFAPQPYLRHIIWIPDGGFLVAEVFNVKSNADDAEFLQEFCPPTCPISKAIPTPKLFHREHI